MSKFIAYYRVSTQKQGRSGLGLEAQRSAVEQFINAGGGEIIDTFTEIMSGRISDRPQLEAALRKCRLTGSTLLVAKLDRLSRSASFLLRLRDSGVDFVCADMPEANRLTVGIMANMAEYEAEMISLRTKAAMTAAKERGVKMGNPRLDEVRPTDTTAARRAHQRAAQARNAELMEIIEEMEGEAGRGLSSREIAARLNEAGITTARGKPFSHVQVLRIKSV